MKRPATPGKSGSRVISIAAADYDKLADLMLPGESFRDVVHRILTGKLDVPVPEAERREEC